MPSTKWSDVEKGSTVELKGQAWTVGKIKLKGKRAIVTVTGKLGTFTQDLKAKDRVEVVADPERWASKAEAKAAAKVDAKAEKRHAVKIKPVVTMPPSSVGWDEPEDKAERKVRDVLGAKLVAVEGDDGIYRMPPVGSSIIAGHLLVFHGLTTEGATMAEAKAHQSTHTATEAVKLATWEKLRGIHDADHAKHPDPRTLAHPHIHVTERPAS